MKRPGKFRPLLATLRIANAPSVASNVWLGVVLGQMATLELEFNFAWNAVLPALAGVLLYFAGNLANDWFDRDWDRTRRPERASLQRRSSPPAVWRVARPASRSPARSLPERAPSRARSPP